LTRNKIKKTKWDYFNSGFAGIQEEDRNINKQQNFNKRMKEKKFFSFITTLLLLMSVVITTKAQFGMPPINMAKNISSIIKLMAILSITVLIFSSNSNYSNLYAGWRQAHHRLSL
jgi:hypothetical protein